ncbi:TetR/AcrR family transcriptional regulator [Chryseobacterium polytrichastri]|uniref:Transcriptional regulator, TetR family n=1 Tax=Chryseobacterium polytrichastri TaxID=1302687 RepID=A0A1M7GEX9_9FLAO|nr:TetR/AcrR family transcriptional regulator [Chryseobacterium polytrichastri]SHM14668.1 transcriptional regulator, TetR family [Chryseobacterium polytrichastri]
MAKESAVRERILDVTSQLFAKQGYNSTGINQIISEAEIARASLYNHFPSKTDLLHAYVERKDENWFKELDSFLKKHKDPKQRILGIFDFRITRQIEEHFGGCPFVKVSTEISADELKAFQLVRNHKERLRNYISSLVSQIKITQQLLNADMLSETIYLLMEGATVSVNINKQKEALSTAKEIVQQLLV